MRLHGSSSELENKMDKRVMLKNRRIGASVVEFAVVLPLFVTLVLGGIELGRAMLVRHTLEEAARAGCRLAVASGGTTDEVKSIVATAMNIASISEYTVKVDPDPPSTATNKTPVTVTVSALYDKTSWLPVPAYLGGKTIVGRCVMPSEGASEESSSSGSGSGSKSKSKSKKSKSKSKKK